MESACGSLFWDLFKNALWKPLFSGFPNGGSRKQCHVRQWIKTKIDWLFLALVFVSRKQCHVRQWIKTLLLPVPPKPGFRPSETVPR